MRLMVWVRNKGVEGAAVAPGRGPAVDEVKPVSGHHQLVVFQPTPLAMRQLDMSPPT